MKNLKIILAFLLFTVMVNAQGSKNLVVNEINEETNPVFSSKVLVWNSSTKMVEYVEISDILNLNTSIEFDLTSDRTITGNWEFTEPLSIVDPTSIEEAVNLKYFNENIPSEIVPIFSINDDVTITDEQVLSFTQLLVGVDESVITLPTTVTTTNSVEYVGYFLKNITNTGVVVAGDKQFNCSSSSGQQTFMYITSEQEWYNTSRDCVESVYEPPVTLVTPTFIEAYSASDAAGNVSVNITNAVENDVFIAYFLNNAGTPITPTGWTELGKTNWSTYTDYVAYMKVSDGTETSVEFSNGGGTAVRALGVVVQYRGVNTTSPVESFQVIEALNNTVIPTPSLTSRGSNRLAVVSFLTPKYDSNDGLITTPTGYTLDATEQSTTSGGVSTHVYSKEIAIESIEPGTQVTIPISGFYAAFTLLLKPVE